MALFPHDQQYVDAFFSAIRPVEDAYQHDTFAYVAVRRPEGFVLVQGILFLNNGPRVIPTTSFNSPDLRAHHYRLADMRVLRRELVESLCAGKLATPDGDLLFPANGDRYGTMYVPFHAAGLQTQLRLSILTIFGADGSQLIQQPSVDWELRAAPTPFDGLQDLLNEYQLGALRGGAISVEIAALNVAAIDPQRSRVQGEVAKVVVQVAQGLASEKVTVGLRIAAPTRTMERRLLHGEAFEWELSGGFQLGVAEVTVPRAAVLQCVANYDGLGPTLLLARRSRDVSEPEACRL